MSEFAARLIAWQKEHGRHDLPWQGTRDPYRIWLSEIMLQQTQVAAVIPYYQRFIARFPDLASLAEAQEQEVLALWSGLGYYARARNVQSAARILMQEHGGRFPRSPREIARLPGIGRSTAAAIAAFAFGARAAILDGNVKRVTSRCFGIEGFPGDREVEKRLWELAEHLMPHKETETYIQALMDLGATLCLRHNPACGRCPVRDICVAHRDRRVAELPHPRPKRELPQRSTRVLILREGDRVLLEKRPPTGIWGGLLSLPALPDEERDVATYATQKFGCVLREVEALAPMQHGFTHFRLELQPLLCPVAAHQPVARQSTHLWLDVTQLDAAPLPAPIRKLLQRLAEPMLF
jgi:A/G-specific adenine glycosylase